MCRLGICVLGIKIVSVPPSVSLVLLYRGHAYLVFWIWFVFVYFVRLANDMWYRLWFTSSHKKKKQSGNAKKC